MDICNFVYYPGEEVCSDKMSFDLIDGVVRNLVVVNGCDGNLKGIARLVETRPAEEIVSAFRGIKCNGHGSCPGKLAEAIEKCLEMSKGGCNE